MNKEIILNILFWIFIIAAVIMLIWKLLGHSPSEFYILLTFLSGLLIKTWSISEKVAGLDVRVKHVEEKVK